MSNITPINFFDDVFTKTAASVQIGNLSLRDELITRLTQEELNRRGDLIYKGFIKLGELKDAVSKIKPDDKKRNTEGTLIESWTENGWKKAEETKGKFKKLNDALEKALSANADFEPLKKILGGEKPPEKTDRVADGTAD